VLFTLARSLLDDRHARLATTVLSGAAGFVFALSVMAVLLNVFFTIFASAPWCTPTYEMRTIRNTFFEDKLAGGAAGFH
jgi:hypothetical protein